MKPFKDTAKVAGMTVAEVAVIGTGMIVSKKFLDFNTLFKNQIAKDPKYVEKFWIKHQGGIKLVAGAVGAVYVKNPWARMALIGLAIGGFIEEARVLTTNKDGVSFFDKIGQPSTGQSELDAALLQAAKEAEATNGIGEQMNPANMYITSVGEQMNSTNMYPTSVGESYGMTNIEPGNTSVGQPLMAAFPMM